MNNNSSKFWQALIPIVCTLMATTAIADPTDFGDNEVPTQTIEFVDDSDLGGRTARFDATISDKGQRLIVKGLDVMSPLVVRIFAKDIARPVDVSLHRYFWGKPDAEGSTGPSGDWEYRGRANDEVGIALAADEATPVYALVWQGPPVSAAPAPTVVIAMDRQPASSGGFNWMTIGIVGLLLVIAVLLAMQLLQRRSSAAATILGATLLLAMSAVDNPVLAQSSEDTPPNPFADEAGQSSPGDVPNPFADDQKSQGEQYKPEDPGDKPADAAEPGDTKLKPDPGADKPQDASPQTASDGTADSKLKPDPNADKPGTADSKLKPDPNADKPSTADSKLKPDPNADKPSTADSKLKPDPNSDKPNDGSKPKPEEASTADSKLEPDSADLEESSTADSGDPDGTTGDPADRADRSFEGRLEAAYEEIRRLRSEVASNSARISTLEFLINQDREAVPEPGEGAPPISLSCANDDACQRCLASANQELSDLLVNLDKLRIIYVSYIRYRDYMVGLGDSISGFHQLEQAAWYRVKLQIEEATIGLQRAYDNKFDEYKGRLSQSLSNLSACGSAAGDPTFTRESVLFENYVKAKYAREN